VYLCNPDIMISSLATTADEDKVSKSTCLSLMAAGSLVTSAQDDAEVG
jgi:hypothetical protein